MNDERSDNMGVTRKIYVRGSEGKKDQIERIFKRFGVENRRGFNFNNDQNLYYIDTFGEISMLNEVCDTVLAELMKKNFREIKSDLNLTDGDMSNNEIDEYTIRKILEIYFTNTSIDCLCSNDFENDPEIVEMAVKQIKEAWKSITMD